MLQLENRTPFKAAIALLPDRAGVDTLYVIVKATLKIRPTLALAEEQVPPAMADEYHGEPTTSSLRVVSDLHIGKPGTDVILTGSAWAPEGRQVSKAMVSLSAGGRQKQIQVTGDRIWYDGVPSPPRPFESIPLVWERAFGGWHQIGDKIQAEERNPVGCGFAGGRSKSEMQERPVPNLEDPAAPLQQLGQTPVPACFAPIAPSCLPRRTFAGTYDAAWQKSRAPYLPGDFDPRYLQCAIPEFAFDRYLETGERIEAAGVLPDGPLSFSIPDGRLHVEVTVAGATETPPANLETLSIEPDQNRVCFTWRAALPCDRKALKVERIVVTRGGSEHRA